MPEEPFDKLSMRNPDPVSLGSTNASSEAPSVAPSPSRSGLHSPKLNNFARSLDIAELAQRLEALNLSNDLGMPRWGPISASSTGFSSPDGLPMSSGGHSPVAPSISNDMAMGRLAEHLEKLTLEETPYLDLKEPGQWLKRPAATGQKRSTAEEFKQRLDSFFAKSGSSEKIAAYLSTEASPKPAVASERTEVCRGLDARPPRVRDGGDRTS